MDVVEVEDWARFERLDPDQKHQAMMNLVKLGIMTKIPKNAFIVVDNRGHYYTPGWGVLGSRRFFFCHEEVAQWYSKFVSAKIHGVSFSVEKAA